MSSSCGPISNINGKACKGLIGPPCKRLSYSNPEKVCRLKYEPCSTFAGINYLVFLLLDGEPVTLMTIFLFDPLYCNFMYSLQCTFPHKACSSLSPQPCKPSLPISLHQPLHKNVHTSKRIFFPLCVQDMFRSIV